MVVDWEDECFVVKKVCFCGECAAGGGAEGIILDDLKFVYVCFGCVWCPYRDCVIYDWSDDCFVCVENGFFALSPCCACECF